jgi:hypothetical protein
MSKRIGGFSVVEAAIAATTFSIIFLAIMIVFDTTQANFARETLKVDVQQNIRVGVDDFNRDLRLAGYGVPSATKRGDQTPVPLLPVFCHSTSCPAVTPFPACTGSTFGSAVTFMADLDNASTTVTLKATATNQLNVASVARLAIGHHVFITDGDTWDTGTISAVDSANSIITFTSYILGSKLYDRGTFVGRPRCIRYQIGVDSATGRTVLQRDASDGRGWQTIADNTPSLTLNYYDAVNQAISGTMDGTKLAAIRRIRASISGSATPPGQQAQTFQLTGDIQARNVR